MQLALVPGSMMELLKKVSLKTFMKKIGVELDKKNQKKEKNEKNGLVDAVLDRCMRILLVF